MAEGSNIIRVDFKSKNQTQNDALWDNTAKRREALGLNECGVLSACLQSGYPEYTHCTKHASCSRLLNFFLPYQEKLIKTVI